MLYKESICPVCKGHGFISGSDECSVWAERCTNCQEGKIVIPVTNGDLIRNCTNEQLVLVHENLNREAIYSGGVNNRLLDSSSADFLIWLTKATDSTDLRTIFEFVDKTDYEHPWTKVVTHI